MDALSLSLALKKLHEYVWNGGGLLCLVNFKLTYGCVICVFVCLSMD